jgi:hypothetical protein
MQNATEATQELITRLVTNEVFVTSNTRGSNNLHRKKNKKNRTKIGIKSKKSQNDNSNNKVN